MDPQPPSPALLDDWLRNLPGFESARVDRVRRALGGISNLTYRADLTGGALPAIAIRIQRERGIFAPYDVAREARVVRCLADSAVPVPGVLGVETGAEPFGAPFAAYEWIDAPHMGEAFDADFGAYTRAVATIHALDWRGLGLDFLGVPADVAEALLLELERIAGRMAAFGFEGEPLLSPALARLREAVPMEGSLSLCQGDINVFNYLFRGGEVVGVVDWEQAHISDPRSDVGHLLALANLKGAPFVPADEMPFPRGYGVAAGRPLAKMAWFRARWLFELGVIERICTEALGEGIWYEWTDIERLLPRALAEIG